MRMFFMAAVALTACYLTLAPAVNAALAGLNQVNSVLEMRR